MTDADVIIHATGSSSSLAGLSAMEKDEGLSAFSRSDQQLHPSLGKTPHLTSCQAPGVLATVVQAPWAV